MNLDFDKEPKNKEYDKWRGQGQLDDIIQGGDNGSNEMVG